MNDIGHSKKVNNALGDQAGDTLLREIAQIIRRCIHGVDTVARWGGEELGEPQHVHGKSQTCLLPDPECSIPAYIHRV